MSPADGAYVSYDHTQTVGALAAQAARAGALAIGEDLGTVDPWIRDYLARRGILGTTMLWFAREADGSPLRPGHWRRACMATVGTHDVPPVTAFLNDRRAHRPHAATIPADSLSFQRLLEMPGTPGKRLAALISSIVAARGHREPLEAHQLLHHAIEASAMPDDVRELLGRRYQMLLDTMRQLIVEGQATVTLIDYELVPAGMSMAGSPQIVEAMRETMLAGTPDSVQYQKAPLFLKEALTFPYRYGLGFAGEVVAKRGKAGLNELFKNPPTTTRQIMEPDTFLSGEKLPAMPVPNLKRLFKDYDTVDIGGFGEFDTAMLVGQLATPVIAQKIYPHWRGGYYYAVRPKGKPTAPLGLLYVSRWSSAEKATEFAAIYADGLSKRYRKAVGVTVEGGQPLAGKATPVASRNWTTEEGSILIQTHGDLVLVAESLDHEEHVPEAVFGTTSATGTK